MFYLIQFFKTLQLSPWKIAMFIFFTCFLTAIAALSPVINSHIKDYFEEVGGASFVALIEATPENESSLGQLKKLQGIYKIKIDSEEEMKEKLLALLKELQIDPEFFEQMMGQKHIGIKIILRSDNSKKENENVVSEVKDLFGEEKVILGPIKDSNEQMSLFQNIFKNWFAQIVLAIGTLFWFLTLFNCAEYIRQKAYLIEQYGRRKKVSFKMALSGILFLYFVLTIPTIVYFNKDFRIIETIVLLSIFLLSSTLFLKKWKWVQ